ncbi:hypothetical protein C2845_PM15G02890 [Panicum miliaceum]|uniref:Uncharacterized protein n=1 Tax=Panicum miliaceum TaxID=4540 RepID=A0A3L6QAQ9_PANMI|nr:hypothetical protein C2845_PM15G02890 [Panicum miliaceum]
MWWAEKILFRSNDRSAVTPLLAAVVLMGGIIQVAAAFLGRCTLVSGGLDDSAGVSGYPARGREGGGGGGCSGARIHRTATSPSFLRLPRASAAGWRRSSGQNMEQWWLVIPSVAGGSTTIHVYRIQV